MYSQQRHPVIPSPQPAPHPQPQPAPRRAPRRRRPSWMLVGGLMAFGTALVMLALTGLLLLYYALSSADSGGSGRVAADVRVAGIDAGGQAAEQVVRDLVNGDFLVQPVTLVDQERRWALTRAELGVQIDESATLELVKKAAPGAAVQPVYTVDLTQAQNALIALSTQTNIPAVPDSPPQMGRALDIPAVLNRLYHNPMAELGDGTLELTMIITEPPPYDPARDYTGVKTTHIVEAGQELALIAMMYSVDMQDIVTLNGIENPDLLYVGQELVIPAAGVYQPNASEAPAAPTTAGKSIVVSTDDQRIYAYENGQLVHSHLVSTGLPDTPTVKGDYKIYVKYTADDMSGPDYYLPQVPFTMYFYQGYAIHGTYWHNSFGRPMSHGCVNLPNDQAQWFFDWAEVGTPVRVL